MTAPFAASLPTPGVGPDGDGRGGGARPPPPWDPWRAASLAVDVLAVPRLGPAALARRQEDRLHALLEAAWRGSPLWRELLRGRDPHALALADLPVTTKGALMARFDDWVTDRAIRLADLRAFVADPANIATAYLGRYVVWESSGSAGEPAVFVQDARAMAVYDALEAMRRPGRLAPLRAWAATAAGDRVAFVGAVDGHFASTVSIERLRALNPWMAQALHEVSFLLPPAELAARLEAIRPAVLATYPSMADILAGEHAAGRLDIAPREVWTGGETLAPAARARIERAFGARVLDSYGCSECLALASECEHGRLHLNADWALLEAVDARGRPVAPGRAAARTLLTNLANHVQPVIRYDLGDEVTFDARPCACGSALPALRVRGRHDETLALRGRDGRVLRISPLALSTVLEDEAGLYRFQVVQTGPASVELRCLDGAPAGAAQVLRAFLAAQGAAGVRVRACADAAPLRGRSGKVARVVARTPAATAGSAPGA